MDCVKFHVYILNFKLNIILDIFSKYKQYKSYLEIELIAKKLKEQVKNKTIVNRANMDVAKILKIAFKIFAFVI